MCTAESSKVRSVKWSINKRDRLVWNYFVLTNLVEHASLLEQLVLD